MSNVSNSVKKLALWFDIGRAKILGQKNLKTTREWYLTRVLGRPTGAIALNFGIRGGIADVITHAKFYINRFGGFGVLASPILPFSIRLMVNLTTL